MTNIISEGAKLWCAALHPLSSDSIAFPILFHYDVHEEEGKSMGMSKKRRLSGRGSRGLGKGWEGGWGKDGKADGERRERSGRRNKKEEKE